MKHEYDPPLDPGIAAMVEILRQHGVETYESCEGGEGHSYPEPAVKFHGGLGGGRAEGIRVAALAITYDLPMKAIRRVWNIEDGELTGPSWEIVFDAVLLKRMLTTSAFD